MGCIVTRIRGDSAYLYYAYYAGKRRRETYCGEASNPRARKMILNLEKNDLTKQKNRLVRRLAAIERELSKIRHAS